MNGREVPLLRPLWMALAAVLVLTTAVVAVVGLSEPDLVPVADPAGAVTIAGDVAVDQDGANVTATATISADRELVLSALTVRVRDAAGRDHDFPQQKDVALGTEPREITFRRLLSEPGVYTYSLAYELDGQWTDLPPWQEVTIQ
jgi:hypothetical protein